MATPSTCSVNSFELKKLGFRNNLQQLYKVGFRDHDVKVMYIPY